MYAYLRMYLCTNVNVRRYEYMYVSVNRGIDVDVFATVEQVQDILFKFALDTQVTCKQQNCIHFLRISINFI